MKSRSNGHIFLGFSATKLYINPKLLHSLRNKQPEAVLNQKRSFFSKPFLSFCFQNSSMDFHTLTRKELQTLCKKNKIPANIANGAMADALSALEFVSFSFNLSMPVSCFCSENEMLGFNFESVVILK